MRVCMIEACDAESAGSIGAFYVCHHAGLAGYKVDVRRSTSKDYDVEMISLHHASDFPRLAEMQKKAKWRIVGGHPMQNNPRPVIPYADAICVGEGESWIKQALPLLEKTDDIKSLASLPGTIIPALWKVGDVVPKANFESPLPENPPYLNRPGTRSAAWYIEMARGCPYRCKYCELGNSAPHRQYEKEYLKKVIAAADTAKTRKINFYAPDEASYPDYNELYDYLEKSGFSAGFSSMRIESVLKNPPKVKRNHLIRVGIDGLTEETRRKVGKPITDRMILDYFQMFIDRGHVQFKMFMIVGYPWDTAEDFEKWERMMNVLLRTKPRKTVSLRLKWTPFIPQPCTPFRDLTPTFDALWYDRIEVWHAKNKRSIYDPGWRVGNDGLMLPKSHAVQMALTSGDEYTLQSMPKSLPTWHNHLSKGNSNGL